MIQRLRQAGMQVIRHATLCVRFILAGGIAVLALGADVPEGKAVLSLTLIPPSPVSDQISLDVRAAVWNHDDTAREIQVGVYLDSERPESCLHRETLSRAPASAKGARFLWPTAGYRGEHRLIVVADMAGGQQRLERSIRIIPSEVRSTRRLGGAWVEIVDFFPAFTPFVRRLAPDKPVMLAPNCFHLRGTEETYRRLLPNLDILCPFGFHRMPEGDLAGEEAVTLMQSLCDRAGCHLWMDLESFVFRNGVELHPRAIDGLQSDLGRFPSFEKILHYQFPGFMSAPWMSRKPGGEASVQLYNDYRRSLEPNAPKAGN